MKMLKSVGFLVLVIFASQAFSATAPSAHEVIEQTTKKVMGIIGEAKGYFDKDPQRFYNEVENVMGEVIDFDSFARGVMGKYASSELYRSLKTKEEQALLRARVKRFSDVFKDGLIQTYAKGLLAFNGNRVEVLPAEDEGSSATVRQHIYGDGDKPFEVQYKLRRDQKGDWKLRNVTIEAINLGKVYQSQFYQAMKQYNDDLDKTIDNWSVDPTGGSDKAVDAG